MKKMITVLGSACLALALVGCGPPPADKEISEAEVHQKVNKGLERVMGKLDATQTQQTKVKAMARELITEGHKVRVSHKKTAAQLKAQWASPRPDRKKAHQLVDVQLKVMRTLIHKVVDKVVDLHAVLTPQQRKELTEMGEKLRKHRRGHRWH